MVKISNEYLEMRVVTEYAQDLDNVMEDVMRLQRGRTRQWRRVTSVAWTYTSAGPHVPEHRLNVRVSDDGIVEVAHKHWNRPNFTRHFDLSDELSHAALIGALDATSMMISVVEPR